MGVTDCIFALVRMKEAVPANNSAEQHHYLYARTLVTMRTSCKGVEDFKRVSV